MRIGGASDGNTIAGVHRNGLVLVDTVQGALFDDDAYTACGVWARGDFADGTFA